MPARATGINFVFKLANGKRASCRMMVNDADVEYAAVELQPLAQKFRDQWTPSVMDACFDVQTSLQYVEAQNWEVVPEVPGPPLVEAHITPITTAVPSVGAAIPGTGVGDATLPQGGVVMSLRTLTPGASGRGRMYFPPPPAGTFNETGRLLGDYPNDFATRFGNLLAAVAVVFADLQVVILSRKHDTSHNVIDHRVDDVVRTQRRRALRT